MGGSLRRFGTLAVLASLLIPLCSESLHHRHAPAVPPDPHDARLSPCETADHSSGRSEGCVICLARRSLSHSWLALEREPQPLAALGFAPAPADPPSLAVALRSCPARAPPAA